jgi:hypothetical protein
MHEATCRIRFSNPRLRAEFSGWPNGRRGGCLCVFEVERHPVRGWRFVRTTTGKPKLGTYGGPACIVDGSDGKPYLLHHAGEGSPFLSIYRGDMKLASKETGVEYGTVWPDHQPEFFAQLAALIEAAR